MPACLERSLAGALALVGLSGCNGIPIESGDTVHYLIVGIGVVSVPGNPDQSNVRVSRMNALGLSLADQPGLRFGLGYSSGTVVAVPADARDVRVEVSQRPLGRLRVQANETSRIPDRSPGPHE